METGSYLLIFNFRHQWIIDLPCLRFDSLAEARALADQLRKIGSVVIDGKDFGGYLEVRIVQVIA